MLKYAAAAPAVLGLGAGLQSVASALAAPRAAAAPLGILLDYAAGVITAGDLRASGAQGAIRMSLIGGPVVPGCWASRSSSTSARPLPQRTEDRVLRPSTGSRTARTGWAGRTRVSHTPSGAGSYTSRPADRTVRRSTRRSTTTPATSKSQVAPYLRGWEAVLGHHASACTPTPGPSTGLCRMGSVRTSGSTTGARRRGSHIRPHPDIRSRSTSAVSGGWGRYQ